MSTITNSIRVALGSQWVVHTEVKSGSSWLGGHLRFDAFAIKKSWSPLTVRIYEEKTSRQDFLNDKKWPEYFPYCHEFVWVCPKGLISKAEIDAQAGLAYYNTDTGSLTTVKKPIYRQMTDYTCLANALIYLQFWRKDAESAQISDEEKKMMDAKEDMRVKQFWTRYHKFRDDILTEANNKVYELQRKMEWDQADFKTAKSRFDDKCKLIPTVMEFLSKHPFISDRELGELLAGVSAMADLKKKDLTTLMSGLSLLKEALPD